MQLVKPNRKFHHNVKHLLYRKYIKHFSDSRKIQQQDVNETVVNLIKKTVSSVEEYRNFMPTANAQGYMTIGLEPDVVS